MDLVTDLELPSESKAVISIMFAPGERVKIFENSPFLLAWRAVSDWDEDMMIVAFGPVVPEIIKLGS